MEKVEEEAKRVERASAEVHDVVRDFIHGINAEKQRDIVRRGE